MYQSYLRTSAISTFARVVPQAVLTPILIDKGLEFDSIIWTQLAYMAALVVAEFPAGMLADRFSRKWLFLLSIALVGFAYGVVWCGNGLVQMAMAWSIYGVGAALSGSTMGVHFASELRDEESLFRRFFISDRNVALLATIAGGVAAALLFPALGVGIYFVSMLCFCGAILYGAFAIRATPIYGRTGKEGCQSLLRAIRDDHTLVLAVLLFGISQFAFTPFFQLWQMIFLDLHISESLFGIIFVAFQLITIISNLVWRRIAHTRLLSFCLLGVIAIFGLLLLTVSGPWVMLLVVALPFPLFLFTNSLQFSLQARAPLERISTLNALMGTSSTIGALVALVFCLGGVQSSTPQSALALGLTGSAVLSMLLLGLFMGLEYRKKRIKTSAPERSRART